MKAGWQTKTFGDVLDIRNGKNQREVESADGEYPIFGSAGNVMGYATSYICKAGATIVGRKGNINTPIYTETNFWNVDTAFGLAAKSELDSRFLYYFCLSYDFSIHNRGTTIPSLVKSDLLQIKIQFPPLTKQQRIVGILDEAFDGIATAKANAEQNLKNARALFESHLHSVFTQRGEGWVEKTLDDVCEQITDGKHGDCKDEAGSGFYFLSAKDVRGGTLDYDKARQITRGDFEETHRRTNLEPGDVLITNSGTIGRMAIAPSDDRTKNTTFQKSVAILKPITREIDSKFMFYCLSAGLSRFVNLSAGAAQKNLLLRDLRSYHFMLPKSLEQQRVVASKLGSVSGETQRLESLYQRKLAALDELKKSLLHQAFSGQL